MFKRFFLGLLWGTSCFGLGGCGEAMRRASLEQQVQTFKETTDQLAQLADRVQASFIAELNYDGREHELYSKQSVGLGLPIQIRLGVMGRGQAVPPFKLVDPDHHSDGHERLSDSRSDQGS